MKIPVAFFIFLPRILFGLTLLTNSWIIFWFSCVLKSENEISFLFFKKNLEFQLFPFQVICIKNSIIFKISSFFKMIISTSFVKCDVEQNDGADWTTMNRTIYIQSIFTSPRIVNILSQWWANWVILVSHGLWTIVSELCIWKNWYQLENDVENEMEKNWLLPESLWSVQWSMWEIFCFNLNYFLILKW